MLIMLIMLIIEIRLIILKAVGRPGFGRPVRGPYWFVLRCEADSGA